MALEGSSLGTGELRALGVLGAGPTVGARGAQAPAHEGPTVENWKTTGAWRRSRNLGI